LSFDLSTHKGGARSHEFLSSNLGLAHTQDIGVLKHNFIGGENGVFVKTNV
jgi:hypothetical protein